jgi:hypothetical protein
MSGQPEFYTYTRDKFVAELVHPDDRAVEEGDRERLGGRARHAGRAQSRWFRQRARLNRDYALVS